MRQALSTALASVFSDGYVVWNTEAVDDDLIKVIFFINDKGQLSSVFEATVSTGVHFSKDVKHLIDEILNILKILKEGFIMKIKKIINLTPHKIVEVNSKQEFEPSGTVARVSVSYEKVAENDGTPFYVAKYGAVENIPAPELGVFYIVSGLVFEATNRPDVIAPGNLVRDEQGRPVGCNGFKVKEILVRR